MHAAAGRRVEESWSWSKPTQKPHPPIILGGRARPEGRRRTSRSSATAGCRSAGPTTSRAAGSSSRRPLRAIQGRLLTERDLVRVEGSPPYATYDLRHQAPLRPRLRPLQNRTDVKVGLLLRGADLAEKLLLHLLCGLFRGLRPRPRGASTMHRLPSPRQSSCDVRRATLEDFRGGGVLPSHNI